VAPDLPVLIEWIDTPDQVERLLPEVCRLVTSGTVTVDDLTIVKHTPRAAQPPH
jgi:PII-like signaling protein